jgi:hypothetical protein
MIFLFRQGVLLNFVHVCNLDFICIYNDDNPANW